MAIPELIVRPGQDPAILGAERDPSGFERAGVSSAQAVEICARIRTLYESLLVKTPSSLVETSPRVIPVYCDQFVQNFEGFIARNLIPQPTTRILDSGQVAGSPIKPSNGVLLYKKMNEELRLMDTDITHELLHGVVQNATHPWSRGPTEALVMGLERHVNDNGKTDDLWSKVDWDMSLTRSTTGLSGPDMSYINYSTAYLSALYMGAGNAFKNVSGEKLWKLAADLSEQGLRSGLYPMRQAVNAAIENVFQEQSPRILNNPAMTVLQQGGRHVCAYQAQKPGAQKGHSNYAAVYTFSVSPRQDYGYSASPAPHFNGAAAEAADLNNTALIEFSSSTGEAMADMRMQMTSKQDLKFKDLLSFLLSKISNRRTQRTIERQSVIAKMTIGGLPTTIEIKK